MHTESIASKLSAASKTGIEADSLDIAGYLGSARVSFNGDNTNYNTSVAAAAARINAVTDSTGVEATAITKGKLHSVSAAGVIKFNLGGNHNDTSVAMTRYAVTATLAATNDLDPLVDAINKHAANTGISAKLGTTAAEIILTHQTGENIDPVSYTHLTLPTNREV